MRNGYYDSEEDIDELMIPLVDVLDGTNDRSSEGERERERDRRGRGGRMLNILFVANVEFMGPIKITASAFMQL